MRVPDPIALAGDAPTWCYCGATPHGHVWAPMLRSAAGCPRPAVADTCPTCQAVTTEKVAGYEAGNKVVVRRVPCGHTEERAESVSMDG